MQKHSFDYLIVGQGIAGSVLSYTFLIKNKTVLVVNTAQKNSSSMVAAGIYNPLTGKRLIKTWLADELFNYLIPFYQKLQNELKSTFLHQMPIYRPYRSVQEQNDWFSKSSLPEFCSYTHTDVQENQYEPYIKQPLGGIETLQAGWVDVPIFLESYQKYLIERNAYVEDKIAPKDIEFREEGVFWKNYKAQKIIFCDGIAATENSFFSYLPFTAVKGEILEVKIPNCKLENIVNQGVSLVPLGNETFKIASTYNNHFSDIETTQEAQNELLTKATELLKLPLQIIQQKAGIRPATKHRRPFVGLHPNHFQMGIFNGLGSKGVSLAPYLAQQFYEHLEYQKPLNEEIDIKNYLKKYFV
jgi:glycine/D-amino acid oxidase-like deaminating enzyme